MSRLVVVKDNAQLTKELENVCKHTCLQSHLIMELMLIVSNYGSPSMQMQIDAMGNRFDEAVAEIDAS